MDIKSFIRQLNLFKMLDDKELDIIKNKSSIKNAPKGSTIHSPQEICKNITVVIDGTLHSSNYSLNGNEQIVCNFKSGDIFGFPVVFGDLTYPEYIITETECRLLYISREVLLELFSNKQFLLAFIEKLSRKIKSFSELVETLSYTSVKERISKYLLTLASTQLSNDIILSKNKTRLAKELGTNRVVVSRIFKTLEDENIIKRIDESHIKILDANALEYFS